MEFTLPKTKNDMYAVLAQLFDHYRVRKQGYEDIVLQNLSLQRLDNTEKTDSELIEKAHNLLKAEHEREIAEYKTEISSKISALQEKIALAEQNKMEEISNLNNLYSESLAKVQNLVIKSGLMNSTVMIDKTAMLEDSKNQKIAQIAQDTNDKIASLTAEMQQLTEKLSLSEEYFANIHQQEIEKKFIELCDEREKRRIEVFKYNNGLDEKEQRYANSIRETKSSLYIRFLDVKSGEYTKDQLVEIGYFKDVIKCVSSYFDTLAPLNAYQTFLAEEQLITYLDYYYEQVALSYKYKAGL